MGLQNVEKSIEVVFFRFASCDHFSLYSGLFYRCMNKERNVLFPFDSDLALFQRTMYHCNFHTFHALYV
jgi:hypothetical protein